jgi:hypothetical protein
MFGMKSTVFCGPMKSGTTWVHEYLKARGDVCLPARTKEIFFFDRYFTRGTAWYQDQFRPEPHHQIVVDVAPSIVAHPDAPGRVDQTFPDANVVILRRDPVARAWSHYLHLKRYGYTSASLDKAIGSHPSIIEASRTDFWLQQWRNELGSGRVHELEADLLFSDPTAFAKKLNGLLGLPNSAVNANDIGKVNGAALPRHHLVSAAARKLSYALRDARMDAVVQLARNMGLNKIYSSSRQSGPPPKASQAERDLIMHKLMEGAESI